MKMKKNESYFSHIYLWNQFQQWMNLGEWKFESNSRVNFAIILEIPVNPCLTSIDSESGGSKREKIGFLRDDTIWYLSDLGYDNEAVARAETAIRENDEESRAERNWIGWLSAWGQISKRIRITNLFALKILMKFKENW